MPWEGLAANRDHSIGVVRRSVTPIANKVDMQIFSVHRLRGFCGKLTAAKAEFDARTKT
jgi:hypothetical protein